AIVNEELFLADLQSIERKLEKDKISEEERKVYKKCMEQLNKEQSVSQMEMNDKEKYLVKALNLLSAKKQLIVANIDEDEVGKDPKKINGEPTLPVSAKLEAELNEYPWVEQQKLLKDLGLKKSAREEVIKAAYQALNLITFYTIAKRTEARAWPIMQGVDAVHAAGKIHTDFAKHFVKVEAINAQELILLGSWHKAHEAGKVITHGRDYIVRDQDVLEFKVSLKER
ncbi:DUF933 domain-containing protein, partial [Candidatus Roizmanbacteria bacterium]|nr:DUF933 domain-containing protein [Candidatus Roizmanbacteria bacterium]